jgi:hypothetical protein
MINKVFLSIESLRPRTGSAQQNHVTSPKPLA